MKRCIRCNCLFSAATWTCPDCEYRPGLRSGILSFAPELDLQDSDYDPSAYDVLARSEAGSFWFQNRNRLISWAATKYFANPKDILEIGCGTGYVLKALREAFPAASLTATDVHIRGLQFAANRHSERLSLLQMDARAIPFRDTFDLVGCFDVLEHIDEDVAVLEEIRATLKPAGVLVLTVPQHMWLWSAADEAARHKRRYDRPELLRKLSAAGLAPVFASSFVSLLLPAMVAARRRSNSRYDLRREVDLPEIINRPFAAVTAIERLLIRAGISFPVGGSLLAVARRAG